MEVHNTQRGAAVYGKGLKGRLWGGELSGSCRNVQKKKMPHGAADLQITALQRGFLIRQFEWKKKRSYSPDSGGNIWTFPIMIPLEKIWVAAILERASELLSSQPRRWATPTSSLLSMKQIFLHSHWHRTYSQKPNSACNKTVYFFLNWKLILIYGHWLESTVLSWCSANRAQKQETQQNGSESAGRPGL